MTISDISLRTSAVGNNTEGQEVTFLFPILLTSEIVVDTRTTADVITRLVESVDYTVSIDGDDGGIVTMGDAVIATTDIHITRDTEQSQTLDLAQGGDFNAENVEDGFDKDIKITQELSDRLDRSMVIPQSDSASLSMSLPNSDDRASRFLFFDADGEPTAVTAIDVDTVVFGAFGITMAGTASASAARTAMGVAVGSDVQAFDASLADFAALTATANNFLVGNGTNDWTTEAPGTARSTLGGTTVGQAVFTAASVAIAQAALEIKDFAEITLCYEGDVLTYENEILTWET